MPSSDLLVQMDNKQLMVIGDACFEKMTQLAVGRTKGDFPAHYFDIQTRLHEVQDILSSRNYNRRGK